MPNLECETEPGTASGPHAVAGTPIPLYVDGDGVRKHLAQLSNSTLFLLDAKQEIKAVKVGERRLWETASVIAYLERCAAAPLGININRVRRRSPVKPTQP